MSFIESGFIYLFVTKGPTILTNLWKATLLLNFLLLCEKAHTTRNRRAASLARLSISKLSTLSVCPGFLTCSHVDSVCSPPLQRHSMDSLTGQQLLGKDEKVVGADEVLADKKIIAFYFSAHWCPPCRLFTPVLAEFYSVHSNTQNKHQTMDVYDVNEFEFDNRISCKM